MTLVDIGFGEFRLDPRPSDCPGARGCVQTLRLSKVRQDELHLTSRTATDSPFWCAPAVPRGRPSTETNLADGVRLLVCAVPEDQRRPSWQERTPTESRKGGQHPTAVQRAKMLAATARLPSDGRGKVGTGEVCAEAGVSSDYVTRCLLPHVDALEEGDVPFERKEHCVTPNAVEIDFLWGALGPKPPTILVFLELVDAHRA